MFGGRFGDRASFRGNSRLSLAGIQVALQLLEIAANFGGDLVARIAVLLKSFVDDAFELQRHARIQRDGRNRGVVQDVVEDDGTGRTGEGKLPGGHLVEDGAERENVRALIQLFSPRLLG